MRVSILQPSYIPWIGFFDQLNKSDVFILLDDVLYTKNDWRNRNRIRLANGIGWLSIPVNDDNRILNQLLIKDVLIRDEKPWRKLHLRTVELNYKKTIYFHEVFPIYESVLLSGSNKLSEICTIFIHAVLNYIGIHKKIVSSSVLDIKTNSREERLLSICKYFHADEYLSGNAAKEYLNEQVFKDAGINVLWHDYQHPYYEQKRWGEACFISHLSILDLLFNYGRASLSIIRGETKIEVPTGIQVLSADEYSKIRKENS